MKAEIVNVASVSVRRKPAVGGRAGPPSWPRGAGQGRPRRQGAGDTYFSALTRRSVSISNGLPFDSRRTSRRCVAHAIFFSPAFASGAGCSPRAGGPAAPGCPPGGALAKAGLCVRGLGPCVRRWRQLAPEVDRARDDRPGAALADPVIGAGLQFAVGQRPIEQGAGDERAVGVVVERHGALAHRHDAAIDDREDRRHHREGDHDLEQREAVRPGEQAARGLRARRHGWPPCRR